MRGMVVLPAMQTVEPPTTLWLLPRLSKGEVCLLSQCFTSSFGILADFNVLQQAMASTGPNKSRIVPSDRRRRLNAQHSTARRLHPPSKRGSLALLPAQNHQGRCHLRQKSGWCLTTFRSESLKETSTWTSPTRPDENQDSVHV